ncbi:hypothetical protein RRG08_021879 [Elysia crispata]|uniref:Uncharacterized protein n=1 Tax=Elysia crispata TaxID=231223 RepID=A0AAE1DFQ1_9GAST|nr:hypothetical protein RRG08_021879 [Elysia crispata]
MLVIRLTSPLASKSNQVHFASVLSCFISISRLIFYHLNVLFNGSSFLSRRDVTLRHALEPPLVPPKRRKSFTENIQSSSQEVPSL